MKSVGDAKVGDRNYNGKKMEASAKKFIFAGSG